MIPTQLTSDQAAIQARIEAEIAEHAAAVRRVEARCKSAFLPILREHGITRVDISYDGGGDEGMMGDVTAYGGQSVRELPSVLCDHYAVDYGGNVRSSALQLEDALSSFAENAVCDHHGGWENRSEEHTSELQSLMRISYAVFSLQKKNTDHIHK